ncbi:hypothetical protein AB0C65_35980 [Nocardia sp. NPDC048505]|uniref:hypothetical protein n=1 Tax=Nocardia sp. NPDC048505 TaxID=3155756 RepID=UPI0033C40CB0
MAVATIDYQTYQAAKAHDYAGNITTLDEDTVQQWKQAVPDWYVKHWYLAPDLGLAPVNVVPGSAR